MTAYLAKKEIARFCKQLQMLLASGIPLIDSLQIMVQYSKRGCCQRLAAEIAGGNSLSAAMAKDFPPLVVGSISSAEIAGNLETILGQLAKYYEAALKTDEKVKSALMYPLFVVLLCTLSLFVLIIFILPGFKSLLTDLDADLPIFTYLLLQLGDILAASWLYILIFVIIGATLLSKYSRTKTGQSLLAKLALKLKLFRQDQTILYCRTLGSLLTGGVPMMKALEVSAAALTNRQMAKLMIAVKDRVEGGQAFSAALSANKMLSPEIVKMVTVGESSGQLGEMLLNIASVEEEERQTMIKRLTLMLEPMLTLTVGLAVGGIALAVFIPLINLVSKLQ